MPNFDNHCTQKESSNNKTRKERVFLHVFDNLKNKQHSVNQDHKPSHQASIPHLVCLDVLVQSDCHGGRFAFLQLLVPRTQELLKHVRLAPATVGVRSVLLTNSNELFLYGLNINRLGNLNFTAKA